MSTNGPATASPIEAELHSWAPAVLGALIRRHGQFDRCEDAVQEALVAAARQWPGDGVPDDPRAWLLTVAGRRLTDAIRSDRARRDRETAVALNDEVETADPISGTDDSLALLFLCCHPSLTAPTQVALTLRAVGGLTTAQIARAYLVPETAMAQRISRAKKSIKAAGARFVVPPAAEFRERLDTVLHVLYLVFNEGYTSSTEPDPRRTGLTAEAIRLTRQLRQQLPDDGEVAGLLALMLLTDSHRPARTDTDGMLVPLADQDRTRWDRVALDEGIELVTSALTTATVGPYQVQAAIAAVHAEATTAADTDWLQIVALYRVLAHLQPTPMVTLNRAAAVAMVDGPQAGLAMLADLATDPRMAGQHRLAAVRAHLLELAGDPAAARDSYREAARLTTSRPEQRYLEAQLSRLSAT